ncbi:MAG: hypothetical protein JHC37_02555 [Campylobacteraceae bacterium]|jgi:hypothetical protein|nr:hypothetical protein [Campylobacteraceae bacterium]
MITISTSDIVKKPRLISSPEDITLIEDARNHIPKSVLLPIALYEKLKEKIEDELYLYKNAKALGVKFDENEDVIAEI